jgi:hypothetical protein
MNFGRRSLLSRLDDTVRWTGIPARVEAAMSDTPSARHYRPLRWIPLWPIGFSCGLFVLSFPWPPVTELMVPVPSWGGIILALIPAIYINGPLGAPSLEDDERQAALRKDALLFCLGLLAWTNCLGQPVLMIVSHFNHWPDARVLNVAVSGLLLNATLFGCLPTLYASWQLGPLPKE